MKDRFLRSAVLFGEETNAAFESAKVFVAGAGAVGGYAMEALARSGVGNFVVADFDSVDATNINRQILALESTVGLKKCLLARERILNINPSAKVEALDVFLDAGSIGEILSSGNFDIVVDAIDSLKSKADLLEYCLRNKISAASSMGAARKTNPLLVRVADITKTSVCPLASKVRAMLRARGALESGVVDCVFSTEVCGKSTHIVSPDGAKILGSCASVTGVFGLVLAHLALSRIAGKSFDFKSAR